MENGLPKKNVQFRRKFKRKSLQLKRHTRTTFSIIYITVCTILAYLYQRDRRVKKKGRELLKENSSCVIEKKKKKNWGDKIK